MNRTEFRYIQTHIRFLKRNGNISKYSHREYHSDAFTIYPDEDMTVHPFDIDNLWLMRESLAHLGISELDKETLNFMEVATAIHELDALLGVVIIGSSASDE